MAAGAGAGAITKTSIAPLERVKILFQVQAMGSSVESPKYGHSITGCLRVIWKEDGFRGFYKGNGANVLRVMPVYSLKFAFNDTFKSAVRRPGQKTLDFRQLIAAGTMAGLFQILATYPLEVVRTRLTLSSTWGAEYRGIAHCFTEIVKYEGFSGLYKGIGPSLISGIPYVGMQMTIYEMLKREAKARSPNGKTSVVVGLGCGAAAGLFAQTATFWGDTLRRRMQTNGLNGRPRHYKNTWDCVKQIWTKEGFVGFYRGLNTNIVRCIPGAAIQFVAYDGLKSLFKVDI